MPARLELADSGLQEREAWTKSISKVLDSQVTLARARVRAWTQASRGLRQDPAASPLQAASNPLTLARPGISLSVNLARPGISLSVNLARSRA